MRTLWSRSLRPQSTCRCISCTNLPANILSRRTTTTGIARKTVSAGDAFTLLLGPVLGSAYIADATAKKRRQEEWDTKIAAVKAQVEHLRHDAARPSNGSTRNLRRIPALARNYHSGPPALNFQVADGEDVYEYPDEPTARQPGASDLAASLAAPFHHSETDPGSLLSSTESVLSQDMAERFQRAERLIAIKLAIRMILHVNIGRSPRYIISGWDESTYHQSRLPRNANELIQHLKQINECLRSMGPVASLSSLELYVMLMRGRSRSLDKDMLFIAMRFRRQEISVTQLVEEFADKLLSSSESPTIYGYIAFFRLFSRNGFEELAFMVDGAMAESRLPFDRYAVFVSLWHYGKNKEIRGLDKLFKRLTAEGAIASFGEQWQWRDINGTSVPLPPNQDPGMLQMLIYVALKCNQPHRAEAWSWVLSQRGRHSEWSSYVINNFMKYYSAHRDWKRGLAWMNTAVGLSETLAGYGIRHLQRVTFSLLDFCASHGYRSLYSTIIRAASESCLGVYSAAPDVTLADQSAAILNEWEALHETAYSERVDALAPIDKARLFHRKVQWITKLVPTHRIQMEHMMSSSTTTTANTSDGKVQVSDEPRKAHANGVEHSQQPLEGGGLTPHRRNPTDPPASRQQDQPDPWKELYRQQDEQLANRFQRHLDSFGSAPEPASSPVSHENVPVKAKAVGKVPEMPKSTTSSSHHVSPCHPFNPHRTEEEAEAEAEVEEAEEATERLSIRKTRWPNDPAPKIQFDKGACHSELEVPLRKGGVMMRKTWSDE